MSGPDNKSSYQDIILDSITEGVFTVDRDWRIRAFNRAAEQITGIRREDAVGQPCHQVFKADICETECALRKTIESGEPIVNKRVTIVDANGNSRPLEINTAILRDETGALIGGVETFRDLTSIEMLRREISGKYSFEDIVSRSHKIRSLLDILPDIAESSGTVLIEGESGTGKELFAKAIHSLSPRKDKPFVAVNCGALPDSLLESELFGYKAGAFTDARKDKPGRFAAAEGGTLLLDEIGDVSQAMQVRLLRVLQERFYEPLGSVEPVKADVRIIASTNKSLTKLVAKGSFREDLYYRINIVSLVIPPLRERMEDIPLLAEHFLARLNSMYEKQIRAIDDDAMVCLMSYDYPGNIRELENIIERSFIICRLGRITSSDLPEPVRGSSRAPTGSEQAASLQQMEAAFLLNSLNVNNWDRQKTAAKLGIHRTTLYRKMRALGLDQLDRQR